MKILVMIFLAITLIGCGNVKDNPLRACGKTAGGMC